MGESLADIPIEDKATPNELLMLVDTYSRKDVIIAVILFAIVIIATTIAGVLGPALVRRDESTIDLNFLPQKNVVTLTIPGLSPRSQFLVLHLTFSTLTPPADRLKFVTFTSVCLFYKNATLVRRDQRTFSQNIVFPPNEISSEPILFFFDRFLSYDRTEVRLDLIEFTSLTSAVFTWAHADEKHVIFQIWIRGTFILATAATLILYYCGLKHLLIWTKEQEWTLFVGIAALIGLDPLFLGSLFGSAIVSDLVDRCLGTFSRVLILLYILVLLDYVGTQRLRACFWPPKICVFSTLFLLELVYPLFFNGWEILGIAVVPQVVVTVAQGARAILEIGIFTWIVAAAIRSLRSLQSIDSFKFTVYSVAFGLVLPAVLCPRALDVFAAFANSAGPFAVRAAAVNSLVLLMIFVHWPYKYEADELYKHPDDAPETSGDLLESGDAA
jgi:hypothetical protein